jgi:hypothetical protein
MKYGRQGLYTVLHQRGSQKWIEEKRAKGYELVAKINIKGEGNIMEELKKKGQGKLKIVSSIVRLQDNISEA